MQCPPHLLDIRNMEISEQTLVDIVRNQGMQTQAFVDMKDRLDKVLPYLDEQHKSLEKRVRKVEKKANWITGVGSTITFLLSCVGIWYKH